MSELKAKSSGEIRTRGTLLGAWWYEKYEADKVIAEKDKEIAELEAMLEERNKQVGELKKACNDKDDWCLHTLKENRHHKYKRCLAIALLWLERAEDSTDLENELVSRRRCSKWLELAEKFKEAK